MTTSDGEGNFSFAALAAGEYDMMDEARICGLQSVTSLA
jgi:hypothetical protein